MNIFYFIVGFSVIITLGFIFILKIEKNPSLSYIPFSSVERSASFLLKEEKQKIGVKKNKEKVKDFDISKKVKCPTIDENYKYNRIEINGVKYPKNDVETYLVDKYNYSCLNEFSKHKKKIFFWYKQNYTGLIGYKVPIEDCPINNCEFHDNINRIKESDAVFVDFFQLTHFDKNITPNAMNAYRNSNQKWVNLFIKIYFLS
jgi:hypothetical protein